MSMYRNKLVVFLAIFSLFSFVIAQDAGVDADEQSAQPMDQKDQNDSGVDQLNADGEPGNEAPIPDSELGENEETPQENNQMNGAEGVTEDQSQQASDVATGDIPPPSLGDANDEAKVVEEPKEASIDNAEASEGAQPEADNNVVPIEVETNAIEQHPEDVRQDDSAEKKAEDAPESAPIVEDSSPKAEEKVEEKIEEPVSAVNEPEKKQEEDKVEEEEKKEEEEKPKMESAEKKADNSTAIIESPAPTNTTTNSTVPATTEKNKPSIWTRIMCLFIHFGCPTQKNDDLKAGNLTESATRGIRAQGIVFIGGGTAESSSESDEEELGSAEKDHDLSVEAPSEDENKDGEDEQKPKAAEAITEEKEEGKEKGIKISGSFKLGATVMHSEVDEDGVRRSNITQINAEMAN